PRRVRGITAWAGLGLLGLFFVFPVGPDLMEPAATSNAVVASGEPWASSILWNGQLAMQVCAPNGIASCTGMRQGEHKDLHILPATSDPSGVHLELRWEPTSASASDLTMWLDAVTIRQSCDDCVSHRYRVLEKVHGTSPLTLSVSDLELAAGEQLAILVRIPDELSGPVMAQARSAQPFVVDGTIRGE
ncbi:MAG TPA: hypothetical protein VGB18_07965, partial [Candidatus Thermoplasmatota archaeon]